MYLDGIDRRTRHGAWEQHCCRTGSWQIGSHALCVTRGAPRMRDKSFSKAREHVCRIKQTLHFRAAEKQSWHPTMLHVEIDRDNAAIPWYRAYQRSMVTALQRA